MASIDLVVIGSEVLNGFTLDTNTRFIATKLFGLGLRLNRVHTLRDDANEISKKLKEICAHSDLVITTGGLGPTTDDLTVDILSELAGVEPVYDPYAKRRAETIFRKRQKIESRLGGKNGGEQRGPKREIVLKQTRVPQNSVALKNEVGIAPGIWMKELSLIALPGFPIEIRSIWKRAVKVIQGLPLKKIHTRIIPIWSIGESQVFSLLDTVREVEVGVHALPFGCRLFLSSGSQELLGNASQKIESLFSGHIIENPLLAVLGAFRAKKITLSTIESCTGGLLAKLITDEAGVSEIFYGSLICYSNAVKESLADVPERVLTAHGAVSRETVCLLARSGLKKFGSDIVLATTGIAGPGGGSRQKPVGTVYVAIADRKEAKIWAAKYFFPLGRERFRTSVSYALFMNLYQKYIFFDNTINWQEKGMGKDFTAHDL